MSHYGTGGTAPDEAAAGQLIAEVSAPVTAKWSKGTGGPSGDECQNLVAHTLRGVGFDASEDGTGRGTPLVAVAFSSKDHGADATVELSPTLRAGGFDGSHANGGVPPAVAFIEEPIPLDLRQTSRGETITNNRAEGTSGGPTGTGVGAAGDPAFTVTSRGQAVAWTPPTTPDEEREAVRALTGEDVADPITASEGRTYTHEGKNNFRLHNVVAIPLQEVDCPREAPKNGIGVGDEGDPMFTLQAAHQHGVAVGNVEPEVFQCHGSNVGPMGTLRTGNGALTGGVPFLAVPTPEPVPFIVNAAASNAEDSHARETETARCLDRTGGFAAGQGGTVVGVALRGREGGAVAEVGDEVSGALRASQGGGDKQYVMFDQAQITHPENRANPQPGDPSPTVAKNSQLRVASPSAMRIRRLTPLETERLQGMKDGHTLVPIKQISRERLNAKNARRYREIDGEMWLMSADGPRYEAVGNSFAVECVRWIGERVAMVETLLAKGVWQS